MINEAIIRAYVQDLPPVAQEVFERLSTRESTVARSSIQFPVYGIILKALDGMPQIKQLQLLKDKEKEKRVLDFVFADMELAELIEALEVASRKEMQKTINKIGFLQNASLRVYGKLVGLDGGEMIRLRNEDYPTYLRVGDAMVMAGLIQYLGGNYCYTKDKPAAANH